MKNFGQIKFVAVGCAIIALAACSSAGHDGKNGNGNAPGTYSSGLGSESGFPGANAGQVDPRTGERFNTVYFSYDDHTVEQRYIHVIEANASYLKAHPNAKVRLEGHTDPRGSREYNIGLGQRRGNSVEHQLHMLGVHNNQMVVVSYGKEKLAVPGNSPEDYRLDRRVEIIYENQG